ncbi:chitin synthase-domain-containing protein [Gongronella butleri]|nr:chitin synthase-domain-containing protein [Gongronella butleri]
MGKKDQQQQQHHSDLIHADDVKACLQARYANGQLYTNLGTQHLVAINPFKTLAYNDDQTSLDYVAIYKDSNQHQLPLDPHLFDMVNRAYYTMRRTGNDQLIMLNGISGSGKSTLRPLILKHLVRLGSHKKETKVQQQLLQSQVLLDAFGQAAVELGATRSLFGYYGEVQFSERGRLIGSKTLHYCLAKQHVVDTQKPNFRIFYHLMGGMDAQERHALQLPADGSYKYLKPSLSSRDDHTAKLAEIKAALKLLGLRKEQVARVFQLLAALLHLGNLVFVDPAPHNTNGQEAAYVKNSDVLDLIADLLGVDPRALENVLTFKTTLIRRDVTTLILNAQQADQQRDHLVKVLYSLLFSWLVERINRKTCADTFSSMMGVLDFPGAMLPAAPSASFHDFCMNLANERLHAYFQQEVLGASIDPAENLPVLPPAVEFASNDACISLLTRPSNKSVCGLINDMTESINVGKRNLSDTHLMDSLVKYNNQHACFAAKSSKNSARMFAIDHFTGNVAYDPRGFLEANSNQLSIDFVSLFCGSDDTPASWNAFVVDLFSDDNLATNAHPRHPQTIVAAQQSAKPMRQPSVRKSLRRKQAQQQQGEQGEQSDKKAEKDEKPTLSSGCVLQQLQSALDDLFQSVQEATLWSVTCIQPNDQHNPALFDTRRVQQQIDMFQLPEIAKTMQTHYAQYIPHDEFLERYAPLVQSIVAVDQQRLPRFQCDQVVNAYGWQPDQARVGSQSVLLAQGPWMQLENQLRQLEKAEQREDRSAAMAPSATEHSLSMSGISPSSSQQHLHHAAAMATASGLPAPSMPFHNGAGDDRRSFYSEEDIYTDDQAHAHATGGGFGSGGQSFYNGSDFGGYSATYDERKSPQHPMVPGGPVDEQAEPEEKKKLSRQRRQWLWFVWAVTWWIPSPCLAWCGRMKRKDIQIAWREKFALCFIVFLMCAFVIWFLVFFGELVCPHQDVYAPSELQSHGDKNNAYVSLRGEVFDLTSFAPRHYPSGIIPVDSILSYGGKDITSLFPVQVSDLCQGDGQSVSQYVSLDYNVNYTDPNAQYHDYTYASGNYVPNWYYDQLTMLRQQYKKGNMAFTTQTISDQASSPVPVNGITTTRNWAIIDGRVYDLTSYLLGGRRAVAPPGQQPPGNVNLNFIDDQIVSLFRSFSGTDVTSQFNALNMDPTIRQQQLVCLRNLYYVGLVDTRNSPKCQFSTYFLLIITCLMASVILFKFLAALRIGSPRAPEEHDKFVICQVTCYTEDDAELRKTIDSIAKLTYDDKRKLMFIICDGMIVGSGNDRPTPRIVLDILGVDSHVDPEPLSFVSVGEGSKQHNMGKVYSGLYETSGHVVPYLVVVKCGKPSERQKPGNRGKRDSQLVLMQFLNRVHFDAPMNPLQLEIFHQMKNVIGVNPSFYEFVLMVDADTEVLPDGLNNLVSSAVHDSKIIGICGETTLANEKATWVTMIQVYEYFVSHHMIKAFESLFSSVSCLPGCFTMYRVRTVDGKRPLFISNEVINDYSINNVETLHEKNLLHLGEDRYLTTLLLKHFSNFKTKFASDAQCRTNAPDLWSVLVSQRRRWINSTVHNLGELIFLPRLCGFCCFSMRFVVMLDLISTLVMPALVGYLGYLIYSIATATDQIPYISIATIAAVYGLQAILFIIKRKWEYIIWMIVSILAIPVFWFYIPIYSYWHFDDFSWGNTRIVMGDKGKKVRVTEEGHFDPSSIPTMTWSEYEKTILAEEWHAGGNNSDAMSQVSSAYTHYTSPRAPGASATRLHASSQLGTPDYAASDALSTHYTTMNPSQMLPQQGTPQGQQNRTASGFFTMDGSMMMMAPPHGSSSNASISMPMMPYAPSPGAAAPSADRQSRYSAHSLMSPSNSHVPLDAPTPGAATPPPFHTNNSRMNSQHSLTMDQQWQNDQQQQIPRDDELLQEIQHLLSTSDLTEITKKQVREHLQQVFGVSMASRKNYINACIEDILQGRL